MPDLPRSCPTCGPAELMDYQFHARSHTRGFALLQSHMLTHACTHEHMCTCASHGIQRLTRIYRHACTGTGRGCAAAEPAHIRTRMSRGCCILSSTHTHARRGWREVLQLNQLPSFMGIADSVESADDGWKKLYDAPEPHKVILPGAQAPMQGRRAGARLHTCVSECVWLCGCVCVHVWC